MHQLGPFGSSQSRRSRLGGAVASALLSTTIVVGQMSPASSEAVPLCNLFDDLKSYDGRMISVRGILFTGREIFALGQHCESKFVTKYSLAPLPLRGLAALQSEYVWPTALDLADSAFREPGEQAVGFHTNHEAVDRVFALVRRERARIDNRKVEVLVTVVGRLRMKDHYDIAKFEDGTLHGGGYGHLGAYPAQVVIETMIDPEVRLK